MSYRRSWDDYTELMTLLPEGNRQIATAIGNWARKFGRNLASHWRRAISRQADFPWLP